MPTVLELLEKVDKFFSEKGIESPRLNAELLLAEVLNCKRLNLYLQFDRPLKEDEVNGYREFVRRRAQREPLQYILGKVEFFGLEFKVNSSALIPRPETEILVEEVLKSLAGTESPVIIDIGTGSGNICAALASKLSNSKVYSMDINEQALALAEENIKNLNLLEKVHLLRQDILEINQSNLPQADLIVSNPPYVPHKEYETLQEEIVKYEPRNAVTDESDGMKFYRRITQFAGEKLKTGGRLFFELGYNSSDAVQQIMAEHGFREIKIIKDYSGINRVITGVYS